MPAVRVPRDFAAPNGDTAERARSIAAAQCVAQRNRAPVECAARSTDTAEQAPSIVAIPTEAAVRPSHVLPGSAVLSGDGAAQDLLTATPDNCLRINGLSRLTKSDVVIGIEEDGPFAVSEL